MSNGDYIFGQWGQGAGNKPEVLNFISFIYKFLHLNRKGKQRLKGAITCKSRKNSFRI